MAGIGAKEIRSCGSALTLGEVIYILVARFGTQRTRKHRRNVAAQFVYRWDNDMARRLVVELLNTLAQIGLNDLDSAPFEEGAHIAFLSQHGLALDQRFGLSRQEDVVDDLIVLGRVARPMDFNAIPDRVAFELFEVVGLMRERVLLDVRGELTQFLPFGDAVRLAVALLAQIPEPGIMERLVLFVGDKARRRFGMIQPAHSRAPLRICAR